ncbi:Acyl-CoA N-acyltransferase with RING/FYVE/PHD-type zinc finger domain [Hordeum vulgare]|nr:Acyl-CoA N-acyltransferase with RING/FYVE/PHD-type zinc finger domain [Hordeum vulgare]
MKCELAFALQSLSEITASPGRTRSGRSLTSPAVPSSPAAKRRKNARSDPPPPDLVSPPTPPLDAEAPKAGPNHAHDALPPRMLPWCRRPPRMLPWCRCPR